MLKAEEVFALAKEKDFEGAFQTFYDGIAESPRDIQWIESLAYLWMQMDKFAPAYYWLA